MLIFQIGLSLWIQILGLVYFYMKYEMRKPKKLFSDILFTTTLTILVTICLKEHCDTIYNFIRYMILYQVLYFAAIIDLKEQRITNSLLFSFLLAEGSVVGTECIVHTRNWKGLLYVSLSGLIGSFLFLFIVSYLTKEALGMGDVKLLSVSGFSIGLLFNFSLLFWAIVIASLYSLYLLSVKKVSKKESIPFAPFLLIGYVLTILLS